MKVGEADWIKNLKVGDQVILELSRFRSTTTRLVSVSGITKTGRIKIGELTFLPNGKQWGRNSYYPARCVLLEATPERIARFESMQKRKRILFNMTEVIDGKRKLSDDQVFRIGEIINEDQGVKAT